MLSLRTLDASSPDFAARLEAALEARGAGEGAIGSEVAAILADVRKRGDAALVDYAARFDRVALTPETLRVTAREAEDAARECGREVLAALELAAARIRAFHEQQMPQSLDGVDADGVRLGMRWTPISDVGMYVPGGLASYPSSVLMNAIPARVAGVKRLVMTVPAPEGRLNSAVLAAARLAGVDEIFRVGGAQAIAALAYGTAAIRPVFKIVGPGNAWVAEAKRQVFGRVGIDMIAGPSEVLVVADGANDPAWIAADMLAQAEHDARAQAILLTDDAAFARRVEQALAGHLATLPRREIAERSLRDFGLIILVPTLEDAAPIVDAIAPEHLELAVEAPERLAAKVANAGAIFLGRYAPEALGDYVAGPSHVLPTSRTARFSSGLSVFDFLKKTSLIGCPPEGFARLAPAAQTLAEAEGLHAHALSVKLRRN